MKNVIAGIVVLALIGLGVAAFVWKQGNTPEARRERLAQEFITCLPDSLESFHHEEIMSLIEMLWFKYDRGLVTQGDLDSLTTKMQNFVDVGSVSGNDLVVFMAEVGYTAYKGEERYRLPSGEVDHPVLNPDAALVDLLPDTAGFAEWVEERKRKEAEGAEKSE